MPDDFEIVPEDAGPDWRPKEYKPAWDAKVTDALRQLLRSEPGKPEDLKTGHAEPEHGP